MTEPIELLRTSEIDRTAPGDPATARSAVTGFGAAVLRHALGADVRNTAISPYSLFTVLAMARAGARGATATQIDAALGLTGTVAQGHAIAAVDRGIGLALDRVSRMAGEAVTVQAANEIWVDRGFPIHRDYLGELAREFGVAARAADFATSPEESRSAVNGWVAERTRNLIPELFPTGSITSSTALVLVNALYLKAAWMLPFRDRHDGSFTTPDGTVRTVPMMTAPAPLTGVKGPHWRAVSIPYVGGGLSMTVLLPDGEIATVLAHLPAIVAATAATAGTGTRFAVSLPVFSVDSTPDTTAAVQALGVTDLFTDADLSGIAAGIPAVDGLLHRCVVAVDENGTEAAAATGMMMAGSAPATPEPLVVDRPFVFWIAERTTAAPLFLGVVIDPSPIV